MADEIIKVKVSQLPLATILDNLEILGVDKSTNKSVRAAMALLRGLDGKNAELRSNSTHVQWRVSGGTWANLVALADLQGPPGRAFLYSDFTTAQLNALKVKGDPGASPELNVSATHIQWRLVGSSTWINLKALSELEGAQGKSIELNSSSTHIQWRVSGASSWINLKAWSELIGPTGKTPVIGAITAQVVANGATPSFSLTKSQNVDAEGNPIYTGQMEVPEGPSGIDAKEPVFISGSVTTLEPNENASFQVVSDGTTPGGNPKFKINISIPRGAQGNPGDGSGNMVVLNYNSGLLAKKYAIKPSSNGSLEYNLIEVEDMDVKSETIAFTQASTRANINTGESIATLFGKIKKWFSDLKSLAFKDKVDWNTDIDNRPASMPASDVYSWAKAVVKPSYSASEVGALPESHNTSEAAHADIRAEVASVRLVAEGALVGYAFDTVAAMNAWIAVTANKNKLKTGNSLFIRALDVPDYWWDGTQALAMETQKVDLSGYLLSSVAASTYVAKESGKSLMTDAERNKLNGVAVNANNYVHPTGPGNNHVPAGGSTGQILRYSAAGTAAWGAENNTTYSPATTSANGLMSKEDKTKLDGVAAGANNYTLPAATATVLGGIKASVVTALPASPVTGVFYFKKNNDMAIYFGNDKIKEIYHGSDKIKEVWHGSELVWKGGGLVLFESNKVNAGFEFFRRVGLPNRTDYYIGDDKIELSYNASSTAIVVGLINAIDVTQFSNLLVKYIVTPPPVNVHRTSVSSGVTVSKTTANDRKYNAKEYVSDGTVTSVHDSMLIDLSNFENTQGVVDMNSCYVYVQLQPNNSLPTGQAKLEISKIELI